MLCRYTPSNLTNRVTPREVRPHWKPFIGSNEKIKECIKWSARIATAAFVLSISLSVTAGVAEETRDDFPSAEPNLKMMISQNFSSIGSSNNSR